MKKRKNNTDFGRVFDCPVADIDMQELLKIKQTKEIS